MCKYYDWTKAAGRASNTSELYTLLVEEVADIIKYNAYSTATARVIVGHLAHKFHLIPSEETDIHEI